MTVNEIVNSIKNTENINDAYIDDYREYNDHFDITVVAHLKVHKGGGSITAYWPDTDYTVFSLRKTSNQIRKILNSEKSVGKLGKKIVCPNRVYLWNGSKNQFDGYQTNYIMIDFIYYK